MQLQAQQIINQAYYSLLNEFTLLDMKKNVVIRTVHMENTCDSTASIQSATQQSECSD